MQRTWLRRVISFTLIFTVFMAFSVVIGVDSAFAATDSKVVAKQVTVKNGKYTVKIGQNKVNYKAGSVTLSNLDKLKKSKVNKIVVKEYMTYKGKDKQVYKKSIKLSKFDKKKKKANLGFPYYGKYKVKVEFYNKAGKRVKTTTVKKLGIVAEEYNLAAINGTFGNLLFTLSLWDINRGDNGNPIPSIVSLSRPDAYDWSKLPTNVYSNPYMSSPKSGSFTSKVNALSAYAKDLYSLNKKSKFNVYLADNYVKGVLELMYKNNIPESNFNVTFLSDGSGTYEWFNQAYGDNPNKNYERMAGEWSVLKKAYKKGAYIDCRELSNSISGSNLSLSKYTYVVTSEQNNVEWWVARKSGTFKSNDSEFLSNALSKMTEKNLNNMLVALQSKGSSVEKQFKSLYHFNSEMFSAAEKSGKDVMVLMGSRVTSEKNFEQFATYIMSYYGKSYEYYYKGHPATPTKLYPEKQKQLNKLGIHDVESSIAAELILFFYPDIYCSGMSNSTLNYSYKEGKVGAYLGARLADKDKITGGELFKLFFTNITDSYEPEITSLCNMEHDNFLVEFVDNKDADIAIYDYTNNKETRYKKQDDSYVVVK